MAKSSASTSAEPVPKIPVQVRDIVIGAGAPVRAQSRTQARPDAVRATVRQIRRLAGAGCELVRIAVPDQNAASALPAIRQRTNLPLVADIHFDHRLALAAIKAGFDKIRINPGNIGSKEKVGEIIRAAKDAGVAIRIGVNSGSIPKDILARYRHPSPPALLAAIARALEVFEKLDFHNIVLSAKTTSVRDLITVNEMLARTYPYPVHLGLTESGSPFVGGIRSAAALAPLLLQGIGDTIRISLTGDPVLEVIAGYELLAALGLRQSRPLVYSCPGCGRTRVNINRLARAVEKGLKGIKAPIKVAVMGCVVNGPGEAQEADFGIACGQGRGALFVKGKVLRSYPEDQLVAALLKEITRRL